MADYKKMIPWIKKWEGGWSDDPDDNGGATMQGVTLATFRRYYGEDKTKQDLRNITEEQWAHIFKTGYWDKMKADYIENQSIAELCVQMAWGSGPVTAAKKIQMKLGVAADGIIGPVTLAKINAKPQRDVFVKLWEMRRFWLIDIGKRGNNSKFVKGWLRRLDDLKWRP